MMELSLISRICTCAALILGAYATWYAIFASPLRHIPGPFFAKFTNLWRYFNALSRRPERYQRRLHDQLGPFVRVGPNMVSISDPAMIEKIYSRKQVLIKSDFYTVNDMNINGQRVPNVFSTRDELFNTEAMKPVHKIFSMGMLLKMEPILDNTVTYFIQRLDEEFASCNKVCEIHQWTAFLAWDIMSEVTLSRRLGFLEAGNDVAGLIQTGEAAGNWFCAAGQIPWLDSIVSWNGILSFDQASMSPATTFCIERIQQRRAGTDGRGKTSTPDFLDRYIEAQTEHPDVVNDNTMLAYLMANVAAGSDTVAGELRSILYHLCKNRKCMMRLQQELDEANVQVPLSWAKAQSLPYLCACVEEGMRIMPSVSTILERVVGEAGLLLSDNKTFLPAGTVVGINPFVVNRDREVFGASPSIFRPERWLQGSDETEDDFKTRVSRMRSSDMTFGAGKRQCSGRNLALLEVHKIIGSLLRTFDFELVNLSGTWTTCNSWFMRQKDMDMCVKKRII